MSTTIPQAFIWRRLHSLTGFWLSLYLIEHLLTNSQAALLIGDNGYGFIHAVNQIKNLPYLPVIELILLGVPISIHLIWGIIYVRTAEFNSSWSGDGSKPILGEYPRNQAYTWQRLTSWMLLVLLLGHIVHMRVIEFPSYAERGAKKEWMVRLDLDAGLYPLAERLNVHLYDKERLKEKKQEIESVNRAASKLSGLRKDPNELALLQQKQMQNFNWLAALEKRPIGEEQAIAVAPDFGTAELLMVRDTFKMPVMIVLYTLFVLAACYHGFNGLWTFMIKWGITLTVRSQLLMRYLATLLMIVVAFLGLVTIYGTYWVNLRQ